MPTPHTPTDPTQHHVPFLPDWLVGLLANAERVARLPVQPTPAADLVQALHPMSPQQIAEALLMAGWRRESVWSRTPDERRKITVWWSPPGQSAPRTPRGRPRVWATLEETLDAVRAMGWLPAKEPNPKPQRHE